ncbi:hypothetical protein [Rossellomorea aquimaris]|uniref:Uncharacterized protein n=1 Tax=Rossellomorea aquimaris TaxID=189382 RepID=A0A5D4TP54_9BACI|nr:hypothetical protein [Rossellomorea aquimaris]TYS77580.1 hypothetical protein FZD05_13200 [Rossellomorea aquimaris]TYS86762.1 hypothetical protein FZC85_07100 [Rossellomorea aquimaris]
MKLKVVLASILSLVMFLATVVPLNAEEYNESNVEIGTELENPTYEEVMELSEEDVELVAELSETATLEELSDYYNEDLTDVNINDFEEEFETLINDPVFSEMEEVMALQEAEALVADAEVNAQWVPVVAAALRVLVSKVGKKGMQKGWSVARPHIEKALKNLNKYYIDGPSGGRIIQVRNKSDKKPIFRLDYHYIDGKGPYLHYHVAPNMKAHHHL